MIIRPDTTADLEILKVPTPDSIDPEMFVPPGSLRARGEVRRSPSKRLLQRQIHSGV
jgi:hypothetical protein